MTIVLKITGILCFTLICLSLIGSFGPHKVKAVKTVTGWSGCSASFDAEVNVAITEGWRVTQLVCMREDDNKTTRLIVFLEK
jgi:hypothetical protein